MRVEEVLARKGDGVHAVSPEATLREAAELLLDKNIGALVCTDPSGGIVGLIGERELARALARFGADVGSRPVSQVMTRDVFACASDDEVDYLLAVMTETRCRHIPVVREGEVIGLVSIGDLVKARQS